MTNQTPKWSKADLKIYTLMLCAKIDQIETEEEIAFIKSRTDDATFNRLYKEFCNDNEDACFEKIEDAVNLHEYSPKELDELKREIRAIFHSDEKFVLKEQYLEEVFDNILY